MGRHVALLRAVNVAGHSRIASSELVRLFTAAGARDVSSFGHAGNLLFSAPGRAAELAADVRAAIGKRYGERPEILLRTATHLAALDASRPFAAYETRPHDKLYVAFLAHKPRATPTLPIELAAERLTIIECRGRDVLLTSGPKPSGFFGFPNAFVETTFGVHATTRNWSTVTRLAALLKR
jgi:uncharacterized protein (DUF1697 family)